MSAGRHEAAVLQVIIPVYNEGANFPALYERLTRELPAPYRLLVVYDFEEDDTLPVVRRLQEGDAALELVKNPEGGFVGALKAGFAAAGPGRVPCLVVMADLSDDLAVVPAMLERWREGHAVVCASRYVRGGRQDGGPLLKRTLSRLAGWSFHLATGIATHDLTNNFRLYDRDFLARHPIESVAGCEVALELTVKAFAEGAPIAEVPATWTDRTAGRSRFRLWRWLPHYLKWYLWGLSRGAGRLRPR